MRRAIGFTLIEVSIVLVIIGLILAMVMRGGAVLDSSKAADAISIANDISAGAREFKQRYQFWPGDFAATAGVFPEVANSPFTACTSGNSDGVIDSGTVSVTTGGVTTTTTIDESACVPSHLFFAGFTKAQGTDPGTGLYVFTSAYGPVRVLSLAKSATYTARNGTNIPVGVTNVIEFSNIPCKIAVAIDLKIDDGNIATGKAQASQASTNGSCDPNNGGPGEDAPVSYAVAL